MSDTLSLKWEFSTQWAAWWLVYEGEAGAIATRGFGPFNNAVEIQCAADVHKVPFPMTPILEAY